VPVFFFFNSLRLALADPVLFFGWYKALTNTGMG
jgi:hypothetical protein